jgi:hypothetical protein
VVVLKGLTIDQSRQVLNFAKFLAQEKLRDGCQSSSGESDVASENWIDKISGSFKDDEAFDEILRYGREYREYHYPDYCKPEVS